MQNMNSDPLRYTDLDSLPKAKIVEKISNKGFTFNVGDEVYVTHRNNSGKILQICDKNRNEMWMVPYYCIKEYK